MRILQLFFHLILFLCARVSAQAPGDEPCSASYLTVNPISSTCTNQTTFTINNSSNPNSYFTGSTSLSSGVNLPAISACGYSSGTNDFWYKIIVPASGYFSIDLLGTNNNKFFDWICYTSSNDADCLGSSFTEVPSSLQCQPNTSSALTNVGPLVPGAVVYLRMWLHANINQASRATFILCVTQLPTPQQIPDCPVMVFPKNFDSVANNSITLQWQSAANARDYLLYFRDSSEHEPFVVLANSANTTYPTSALKYGHFYEWYVVPINADGIANSQCVHINSFIVIGTPPESVCRRAALLNLPAELPLPVNEVDNSANSSIDFGCLGARNNSRYFWFKINSDGDVKLRMRSTINRDFDFAVWGPFSSVNPGLAPCVEDSINYSGFPCNVSMGSPLSCDGSALSNILLEIDTAKAGELYLMIITNSAGELNTISISPAVGNSAGYFSNCSIAYFSAVANTASCSNNNYSIDYTIMLDHAPSDGQLIIADEFGPKKIFNAPFASSVSGTLSGFITDGKSIHLQAYFSSNSSCSKCLLVQPPHNAPPENECSSPIIIAGSNASGYLNGCTGINSGELTDCGLNSCKTVYTKLHTQAGNGSAALSLMFNGGNMATSDCLNGIRVSLLNDCSQAAIISPNCQFVNSTNSIITFSGLLPSTDYYLSFSPVNCNSSFCTWNYRILGTTVLPVELGAFSVAPENNYNLLVWNILATNDIKEFEVYCKHNEEEERMVAVPIGLSGMNYQLRHEQPIPGINVYRIKIIKSDGTYYWSRMIRVNNLAVRNWSFTIVPNPVREKLHITGVGMTDGQSSGQIQIMDIMGRVVYTKSIAFLRNRVNSELDVSKLPSGIYYLSVIVDGRIEQTKSIEKL